MKSKFLSYCFLLMSLYSCNSNGQTKKLSIEPKQGKAIAVFAEGCFWCGEHVFEAVVGVDEVVSGYSGGKTQNPTYEEVGSETTDHAESVMVYYDPKIITYKELLNVFFASHDPTTENQQGPDRGSSYRSIAFYKTDAEKTLINEKIKELNQQKVFSSPIVTQVLPLKAFYAAEDYHQNYVANHPENGYVQSVSIPRYNLFKKRYKGKLKPKA